MAKIEDFEKRYVNIVDFNEGDTILVTEENIEPLRKALKNTNFHGYQDITLLMTNRVHLNQTTSSTYMSKVPIMISLETTIKRTNKQSTTSLLISNGR